MSDKRIFVDTNILVYAHHKEAGAKHEKANALLVSLWENEYSPSISIQVAQEFYVTLVRKGVSEKLVKEAVEDYLSWTVVDNDRSLFLKGLEAKERWKLSLWDAMIVVAAERACASEIWSEDFNTGQKYNGIEIINPLV